MPKNNSTEVEDSRFHDTVSSSVFMSTSSRVSQVPVDPCRCSSWLKLKRIQAWVDRFIENCKKNKDRQNNRGVVG